MERKFAGLKKADYKPFSRTDGFSLMSDEGGNTKYMVYQDILHRYCLDIKPGGFVPKSGLLLAKNAEGGIAGKDVLDMCTGETGMVAIHSATFGAKSVLGVDVDAATVEWAQHNAELNNCRKVRFTTSHLFSEVDGQFDVITTNPPQMPMLSGHFHDSGGPNGREIIEETINEAPAHLRPNGEMYMLLFDFLGVEESFGRYPSIKEVFERNGFDMQVVDRTPRIIRKGGATEQSLSHIHEHYPSYVFRQDGDTLSHEILIVRAVLRSSEK